MSSQPYTGLNKQFINGQWLDGQSTRTIDNINPYTQETLCSIKAASQQDVDQAFKAAQTAFKTWSQTSAEERKAAVAKIQSVIEQRSAEIIDLLITESGSNRSKAEIEIYAALNILKEAATFPDRMKTVDLPNDGGLDSRAYRQALGVIGVITPWN